MSRRKAAFIGVCFVNMVITLSQQQFMFQLFAKDNVLESNLVVERVKIAG
jgi:hypothetical protein